MNIFHAIATNHLGSLIFTVQEDGAEVNSKDAWGNTPLHHAIQYEYLGMVEYLVQNGADINAKNDEGETPLDWANHCKDIAKVRYLIEKGAE